MKIPRVYKQLSGSRVLVMEWIDGIRCTNPQVCCPSFFCKESWEFITFFLDRLFLFCQAIKDAGLDIDGFLTIGVSAALRQLLEFGLFHGDPHPGNIFAMRDGRIAYVDFGNVAQLSQVWHVLQNIYSVKYKGHHLITIAFFLFIGKKYFWIYKIHQNTHWTRVVVVHIEALCFFEWTFQPPPNSLVKHLIID